MGAIRLSDVVWIIGVVATIALVIALNGCAAPQATQTPQATVSPTAAPRVDAGDNAAILTEIKNEISQVQNTVSRINNSYGLDEERRKAQDSEGRRRERQSSAHGLLVCGVLLFAFMIKAPVAIYWRGIIMLCSISLIAGSYLMPFLWPY